MKVTKLALPEILKIEPLCFGNARGFFLESYNRRAFFQATGLDVEFVQDNHSCSQKGVLRGLHFQREPYAQGKLVRVVQGKVWDVAVDIRPNSKTYGEWVGVELSAENKTMFWIPEGFAHGFLALEDNTQFLYKTTNYYNKDSEGAIIWNDPMLAIEWPLNRVDEVVVSEKDLKATKFSNISACNLK